MFKNIAIGISLFVICAYAFPNVLSIVPSPKSENIQFQKQYYKVAIFKVENIGKKDIYIDHLVMLPGDDKKPMSVLVDGNYPVYGNCANSSQITYLGAGYHCVVSFQLLVYGGIYSHYKKTTADLHVYFRYKDDPTVHEEKGSFILNMIPGN